METIYLVEALAVLSAWAVVAYTLWRWGPGRRRRAVRCPSRKVRAKVEVEQRESEFGRLEAADIHACSLFPGAPLNCDKECLSRF